MFTLPTAARIRHIHQENYRTKSFVLDAACEATPGQFMMAWLPRFDEKPFSLVNCNPITLMVTAVGPFTKLLHEKQVGDLLWLRGPFGHGFEVNRQANTPRRLALVGGGYGVAPLLWLAQQQLPQAEAIHVIVGARTEADLLYLGRFQQLAHSANFTLQATTEDGSAGLKGRVTHALQPLLTNKQIDAIYACGPHGMLAALQEAGQRIQIPCQLSWEAYMRCGIGICGSCEHEGKVLCMDGPVLYQ